MGYINYINNNIYGSGFRSPIGPNLQFSYYTSNLHIHSLYVYKKSLFAIKNVNLTAPLNFKDVKKYVYAFSVIKIFGCNFADFRVKNIANYKYTPTTTVKIDRNTPY